MRQLERLLADAGFRCRNLCVEALRATFEIEHPQSIGAHRLRTIPHGVLAPLSRIIPTLIYEFRYSQPSAQTAQTQSIAS